MNASSIASVFDAGGGLVHFVACLTDASRRRAAAEDPLRHRGAEAADRAAVAEIARTMLGGAGYGVEVARDGRDALEKLQGGFDLMVSDEAISGGLDGPAPARDARRRHPGLKVLLTTDRGTGPAGAEFETIGKPYRRSELAETVRRLLDGPVGRA